MKGKKIRGLARRRKAIIKWFESNELINFNVLEKHNYYYTKAKIAPWSNLYNHQQYPAGYRIMLFSMLLNLLSSWKAQLDQKDYEYRLEVWLLWPNFIESQVVASIGERQLHYKNLFKPTDKQKQFPLNLFASEAKNINSIEWFHSENYDYFWESDFEESERNGRFYNRLIQNNQFNLVANSEGEPEKMLYIKRGDVWVGQLK
ncbi:hypothetical protein KJS94_15120 [Flavihumibacter rivuli]|uniref:hypothetical protein n=1 Tax=Flavihumibacter rivuli TaxID=2838156 RepID=UPI001BDF6571|nr:hypothetical protein [Flavihumibacter rivuli]ULQ55979.1 hypothetical protein KJS94_15120 [Flavihumibacter rivuli]